MRTEVILITEGEKEDEERMAVAAIISCCLKKVSLIRWIRRKS